MRIHGLISYSLKTLSPQLMIPNSVVLYNPWSGYAPTASTADTEATLELYRSITCSSTSTR